MTEGKRINGLSDHLMKKYGGKLYKIALDGGMTCPNRDGTVGRGGCIFCSARGSGDFASPVCEDMKLQIDRGIERVSKKSTACIGYIAYFQSYTNTYAPAEYLETLYGKAADDERIKILSVATRPDCLPADVLRVLEKTAKKLPLWVELGLQTVNEKSAEYIRRGYGLEVYEKAVKELHAVGAEVITHQIIGLPFEDTDDYVATSAYIGEQKSDGIKLQLLHVLSDSDLAAEYAKGVFRTLTLDEYTEALERCVEVIPESVVIHRLTGDGNKKNLIAPLWSMDKKTVRNHIERAFERDGTVQGCKAKA